MRVQALFLLPVLVTSGLALAPAVASADTAVPYDFAQLSSAPEATFTQPVDNIRVDNIGPTHFIISAYTASTGAGHGPAATFDAPTGGTLHLGSYDIAPQANATHASLSEGYGSCSANTTGTATVTQLTIDPSDSTVSQLAMDYDLTCSGSGVHDHGQLRMASTIDSTASTASPGTLAFSTSQPEGQTTAAQDVTYTNVGSTPLSPGTPTLDGTNAGSFAVSNNGCAGLTLQPKQSCTISVTATPLVGRLNTATLHVPDATPTGESATLLTVSGVGKPGAPANMHATSATDGVALSWSFPADDGGTDLTTFDLYRGDSAGALSLFQQGLNPNKTSYADAVSAGTLAAHTYYYAVVANNAQGSSPMSAPVSATTPAGSYTSDPTQALVYEYRPTAADSTAGHTSVITPTQTQTLSGSGSEHAFSVQGSAGNSSSSVALTAPTGSVLGVGTYSTQHYADATHAGLTAVDGEICLGPGTLTITHEDVSSDGTVLALAADYTVSCDSGSARGSVRWNSSTPYEALSVEPPVDQTSAPIGVDTTVQVVLHNLGTTTITPSGATLTNGTPAALDPAGDTCTGISIVPGGTCSVAVVLHPTTDASWIAGLHITDDSAAGSHHAGIAFVTVETPPQPTGLRASRQPNGILLQWDDNTGTNYDRPTTSTVLKNGTQVAQLSHSSSWLDPDLANTTRTYTVTDSNAAGSSPSSVLTVTVGEGAPQNVRATRLARGVGLAWSPPTTIGPSTPSSYAVYSGSSPSKMALVSYSNSLSYLVPNVANGQQVYVQVRANYATGLADNLGPLSPPVAVVGTSAMYPAIQNGVLGLESEYGGPFVALPSFGAQQEYESLVVSPDGRAVAVSYRPVGSSGPHVISAVSLVSATVIRNVVNSSAEDATDPAFSPDGATVVYGSRSTSTGVRTLRAVSVKGGATHPIAGSTNLTNPAFVNSSVLVARDGGSSLPGLVLLSKGVRSQAQHDAGTTPSVARDGKRIAYVAYNPSTGSSYLKVWTLGGKIVTLAGQSGQANWRQPSWSPDLLSLVSASGAGAGKLHRLTISSGADRIVTADQVTFGAEAHPDYTAPVVKITVPTAATTKGPTLRVTWSATDDQTGVLSTDVRYRRGKGSGALGAYTTVGTTAASTATVSGSQGYRYCFSVRTRDVAGNTSAWTAERCTTVT